MIVKGFINDNVIYENNIDLQLVTRNNEAMWTEGNYTITLDMSKKKISEIVMVSREITERKKLEDTLTYLAYHDSLTQLGNRRLLMKEYPKIFENAQLKNEAVAVFYVDGDNFKQINDVYGHDVGDEFLIIVTGLSLDENVQKSQLEQVIERIRLQLEEGFTIHNLHFSPTASIGISIYPQHSKSLEVLVDLADRALYKAKQMSKNCYCICDSNLMI